MTRGSKRFLAATFAVALPLLAGACDDPTQDRIDAAGREMAEIMKGKNLARHGRYSFAGVKYLNLKNTQSDLKHGLQAKIVHDDKEEKTKAKANGTVSNTQRPKSYYVQNMCPNAGFIRKYGDEFRIRISIYSVYFNRQFSLDCN